TAARQAKPLVDAREPGEPVLAPPVSAGPGVVVRQVVPGLAVRAVVLADRTPLPLADVRAPPVPVARLAQAVLEPAESSYPLAFGAHRRPSRSPMPPRCLCRSRRAITQSPERDERIGRADLLRFRCGLQVGH